MRLMFSNLCKWHSLAVCALFLCASMLSGCFSAGDDFYSYVVLKGSILRENPMDLIEVGVNSKCTLMANDMDGDAYEVSIGAVEGCRIVWTINNVVVLSANVHKTWDTKNHLTGMEILITDERTSTSKTVYSETPDSREWVIEL